MPKLYLYTQSLDLCFKIAIIVSVGSLICSGLYFILDNKRNKLANSLEHHDSEKKIASSIKNIKHFKAPY